MLQRIISKLDISYNTSLLKRALDASVNSINVTNFQLENSFDISVNYSLETIKFHFDLENVSMSLYNEDNSIIANVLIAMYSNDIANIKITVSNFEYLGNLMTQITSGSTQTVNLYIMGDYINSTDVLRLILSEFSWNLNYTYFKLLFVIVNSFYRVSAGDQALVKETYLVGQSDNKYVASILVGATLAPNVNFAIFSSIPCNSFSLYNSHTFY